LPSKIDRKILDAAEKVFSEHGYPGTTTKEIAVAADVTEGSIFRLFKSKENLFAEVLKKSTTRQMPVGEFRALLEREGTFEEVVQHAVRRWYSSADMPYLRLVNFAMMTAPQLTKEIVVPRVKEIVRTLATAIDHHRGRRSTSKPALVASQQLLYGLALQKMSSHLGIKNVDHMTDRELVSRVVHNMLCSIEQDAA
jgi:AcrR family transcriptional regulator